MASHRAVVTVAAGKPLETLLVPTPKPVGNQVRIRTQWTASTPLDLHQGDGGLLVQHPQVLGDGFGGQVVEVGPDVTKLKVGDIVFGFGWRSQIEKAHQEFLVINENLAGKLPAGHSLQEAVTLPNNFVTAWHTLTRHFGFELPWPKPEGYVPKDKDKWILIWGASSSVGQYTLQILKWYGYFHIIAIASKAHHSKLIGYGANKCFDYREAHVVEDIVEYVSSQTSNEPRIAFVLDCIGSQRGSMQPLARIAEPGAKVAVLLPVIVKDAAPGVRPAYEMDVGKDVEWKTGVDAQGVRTHFYLDNAFLAEKLQAEIMPTALEQGIVEANDQVVVEGATMLERAEKAMSKLRNKEVSGARLVWRVSDDE
ncbi:hypothetical protein PV10_04002 [Exophiala mesophila]|uniref:Enoyl reductase (ER) domain-containing protein n=1 Tax=Exophiala mesophila TaxID=212818 RepID=A0A0D1XWW8_EXOME|nr:uncharacterized protein PV10_04002 [Exophiala mesophila]KIV92731.1 hypothetical protein PV10_04002 [Exophiala mesophila]